jgi:hypothetical protein
MNTTTGPRAGVEWGGTPDERPDLERDERDWPILKPSPSGVCDGTNPMTGRICALGHHNGYHRDAFGAEWLDDE